MIEELTRNTRREECPSTESQIVFKFLPTN